MEIEEMDIQDYQGEVDPTRLIPKIGLSFKDVEELREAVSFLERWQYKRALQKLDQCIANEVQLLDSLLLKGEVLAHFDYNHAAIAAFETVLQHDPRNIYALTMLLVQLVIVGREEEMVRHSITLKKVSGQLYDCFSNTLRFIEQNKMKQDFQKITEPLDLICVFGYFLNDDGSMPARLEERLLKTYELAKEHPKAQVLLSGGAVQNQYGEAVEMKKYLIAAGIPEERLIALETAKDTVGNVMEFIEYMADQRFPHVCVVTSKEHLPRAWMSLHMALERNGYETTLYGAAVEEQIDPEIMKNEVRLSYQSVFRIAGLFEKKEIEKQR